MNSEALRAQRIADYIVGAMEEHDVAQFEAELATDRHLADDVRELERKFSALDDTAKAEAVPDRLWQSISERVQTTEQPKAANSNTPPRTKAGWTTTLRPAAMAASLVIAVGLGFAGGMLTQPDEEPPVVIAVLSGDDMRPGAIVEAFANDSVRIVPLEALSAPQGQVLEVWTLPDEETGPVSLGTFAEARELVLTGPSLPAPQPDQLYEITLEPEGGSPTGRPTGPVLLLGNARVPQV
ncbi:anti-sigma factor [Pelagibacterium montanilacus]|uniref:anti-sigma factor n=1 Tax=Pelagibacterium montanilacus TaxID=2185280 RepID=UPI000F8E06AD|nr:anti-sigma factor [Pelagibacterium montanilacus]